MIDCFAENVQVNAACAADCVANVDANLETPSGQSFGEGCLATSRVRIFSKGNHWSLSLTCLAQRCRIRQLGSDHLCVNSDLRGHFPVGGIFGEQDLLSPMQVRKDEQFGGELADQLFAAWL